MNRIQRFTGFVYEEVQMHCREGRPDLIEIRIAPHGGIRGRCSLCQRPSTGYDRLPERRWQFVPLWGIPTWFRYAPRRVECAAHGVVVEQIPWSEGKRPVTCAMMGFLARWARRLSWQETAQYSRPVGNRCIARWSGSCSGAWPSANCKGWNRWAWTRFIGATGCGRTTS